MKSLFWVVPLLLIGRFAFAIDAGQNVTNKTNSLRTSMGENCGALALARLARELRVDPSTEERILVPGLRRAY